MSLGSAQQGVHLDVDWVGLQVGGSGVSRNPLGGATSVVQFDDISAVVALSPHIGRGKGSTKEQWILPTLLLGR